MACTSLYHELEYNMYIERYCIVSIYIASGLYIFCTIENIKVKNCPTVCTQLGPTTLKMPKLNSQTETNDRLY